MPVLPQASFHYEFVPPLHPKTISKNYKIKYIYGVIKTLMSQLEFEIKFFVGLKHRIRNMDNQRHL